MALNILIGLGLFIGTIIVGGLCFLGIVWFKVNHHWRGPFGMYVNWINKKTHQIKAKAEAKRLSDEWRELNEGSNQK